MTTGGGAKAEEEEEPYESSEGKMGPKISQFSGNLAEYPDWRMEAKAAAITMGAWGALTSKGTVTREQKKVLQLFYAKLVLSTKGAARMVLRPFEEKADGRAAWAALCEKYDYKDTSRMVTLTKEIMRSEIGAGQDPGDYFEKLEETMRQLRSMEIEIPERLMAGIVLANLPASYGTLQTVLCTSGEPKYDMIRAQVISHYRNQVAYGKASSARPSGQQQQPQRQATPGGGVLAAVEGEEEAKCWICGSTEHFKKQCPKYVAKQEDKIKTDQKKPSASAVEGADLAGARIAMGGGFNV